jgi:hypothetical protein
MTCGMIARTAVAMAVLATLSQPTSADSFRNFSGNCLLQVNLSTLNDRPCMAAVAMDVAARGGGFCIRPTAPSARPALEIALSRIRSAAPQICSREASIVAAQQRVQQVQR